MKYLFTFLTILTIFPFTTVFAGHYNLEKARAAQRSFKAAIDDVTVELNKNLLGTVKTKLVHTRDLLCIRLGSSLWRTAVFINNYTPDGTCVDEHSIEVSCVLPYDDYDFHSKCPIR